MPNPDDAALLLSSVMGSLPPGDIGVAVSGGGDSIALLILLADWAKPSGRKLKAVTVDHGLRPESAAEAVFAADFCRRLGVSHEGLLWETRPSGANLQDAARRARRHLIAEWARTAGVSIVALGHTLDDQAETFVMRLARGSGVDGLAAMATVTEAAGLIWARPLLSVSRVSLRDILEQRGQTWIEDPSNFDLRFDRVRARRALVEFEQLGLGTKRLAATAARMARAREALRSSAKMLAAKSVEWTPFGEALILPTAFSAGLPELQMRVLAAVLCRVSGAEYRPREISLEALRSQLIGLDAFSGLTLHGCILRTRRGRIAVRREPRAVAPRVPAKRGVWDRRWRIDTEGDLSPEAEIGALGQDGLSKIANWRDLGIARETLLTLPGLWIGTELQGADLPGAPVRVGFRHLHATQ